MARVPPSTTASGTRRALMRSVSTRTLKAAFAGAILITAIWLSIIARQNDLIQEMVSDFGYLGIFAASVISGFNLLAPVPVVSFTPLFVEAGLAPAAIVVLISLGLTAGDAVGFWVGYLARGIKNPAVAARAAKLELLKQKRPWLPILALFCFAAFAPLPNEIMVIPLALAGYGFWQIVPITLAGNVLFNLLVSAGLLELTQRI